MMSSTHELTHVEEFRLPSDNRKYVCSRRLQYCTSGADESTHSLISYGKHGSGFCSDNAPTCKNMVMESIPVVLDAIRSAFVKPGSVFTIVDYGCADGGNSMPVIYACVKELRKIHGDELPIHVIYEDQPVNDFKSLFLRLQGFIPGTKSYFLDFSNVFVTACGTSFYSQCLPSQTVNLALSFSAMHWLRAKPCDVTGAFYHTLVEEQETKKKLKKQAAEDWELLLLQRAKEMAPGSRMIHVQLALDEERQSTGTTKATTVSILHLMRDLWQGFVAEGLITQKEFDQTIFAVRMRTVDEFKRPFESEDSPVHKAGLSLVSIETRMIPCPYKEKWLKDGGDLMKHARSYVGTLRSWSNATFIDGLSDSRSAEEKRRIVDELYKRYEIEVAKRPEDHGHDYISAFMVMKKN